MSQPVSQSISRQALVLAHVRSAYEILEIERKEGALGDEPTSGQELIDYIYEKPSHLFDMGQLTDREAEMLSMLQRLTHPMADDGDANDALALIERINNPAE